MAITGDAVPDGFRGDWLIPGSAGFDNAKRVYNARRANTPAVIAGCRGVNDIRLALAHARAAGLEVAVRGGGHSQLGFSSPAGGLVIDMRALSWVLVDEGSAWVGGGTLAQDLVAETLPFGVLAVTGTLPSVGVAGLTLHTGQGHLSNRHGFATDNLLAVQLVTADGELIEVSADSHPDLFWAIRGAGANFGVATALKVKLHPAPEKVLGGMVSIRPRDVVETATWVYQHMDQSLDSPCASFAVDAREPLVIFQPCHQGPLDRAWNEVEEFRALGTVVEDVCREMTYAELDRQMVENEQERVGGEGKGVGDVWWMADERREKWEFFTFTDRDAAIALMAEQVEVLCGLPEKLARHRTFEWWWTRAKPEADPPSAQPRRPELIGLSFCITASWTETADDEPHVDWVEQTSSTFLGEGVVGEGADAINHIGTTSQGRIRGIYGEETYARLRDLKRRYDPDNVFHHNQNIPPAEG